MLSAVVLMDWGLCADSDECVRLLLAAGADPSVRNSKRRTARDIAATVGATRSLQLLAALPLQGEESRPM